MGLDIGVRNKREKVAAWNQKGAGFLLSKRGRPSEGGGAGVGRQRLFRGVLKLEYRMVTAGAIANHDKRFFFLFGDGRCGSSSKKYS